MSDGKDQIGDENQLQPNEGLLRSINTVTPLSKYLAMVLFILLPFIGGWVGYQLATVEVVEVEKVIEQKWQEGLSEEMLERTDNLPSTLTPANEIILPNGMSLEEYSELRRIETDRDAPWKTYRNEEYGIEFQYPNRWKQDRDTFISTYGEGDYAFQTNMSIQGEENIHDLNPAERAQKFSDEKLYLYSSVATGTIDGYPYFDGLVENHGMSKYRQVILTKDENILILNIEYFHEEANQDFNSILESLRLIDSKNAWQTYRNEEYGFEFDYPAHIWKLQPHTDEDSTYFSFYNYTDDMGTKVFNINFSGETDITSGAKLITQWNQGLNESTRSYMLVSEYENDQSDYGTYYRTVIDIFSDNELVASIDYTRRPNDQKDEIYNKVVNSIEIKPTEVEQ